MNISCIALRCSFCFSLMTAAVKTRSRPRKSSQGSRCRGLSNVPAPRFRTSWWSWWSWWSCWWSCWWSWSQKHLLKSQQCYTLSSRDWFLVILVTCCILASGLRENGKRMKKWRGHGEKMKTWRENEEMERDWGNGNRCEDAPQVLPACLWSKWVVDINRDHKVMLQSPNFAKFSGASALRGCGITLILALYSYYS